MVYENGNNSLQVEKAPDSIYAIHKTILWSPNDSGQSYKTVNLFSNLVTWINSFFKNFLNIKNNHVHYYRLLNA